MSSRLERFEDLLNYSAIVLIGAAVAWYDMRWFAFYSFVVTIGMIILFTGRLWKLISVSHASNAAKLLIIAKKVGVSDKDFERFADDLKGKEPQAWAGNERDFKDLQ